MSIYDNDGKETKNSEIFIDPIQVLAEAAGFDSGVLIRTHGSSNKFTGELPDVDGALIVFNWAIPDDLWSISVGRAINQYLLNGVRIHAPSGVRSARHISNTMPSSNRSGLPERFLPILGIEQAKQVTAKLNINMISDENGTHMAIFNEPNILYFLFDFIHDESPSWMANFARVAQYVGEKLKSKDFTKFPVYSSDDVGTTYRQTDELTEGRFIELANSKKERTIISMNQYIASREENIKSYKFSIREERGNIKKKTSALEELVASDLTTSAASRVNRIRHMPHVLDVSVDSSNIWVLTTPLYLGPFQLPNMLININLSEQGFFDFAPVYNGKVYRSFKCHPHKSAGRICLGTISGPYSKYHFRSEYDICLNMILMAIQTTNGHNVEPVIKNYIDSKIPIIGYDEYTKVVADICGEGHAVDRIRYIGPNRDTLVPTTGLKRMVVINGARVYFTSKTSRLLPKLDNSQSINIPEMFRATSEEE